MSKLQASWGGMIGLIKDYIGEVGAARDTRASYVYHRLWNAMAHSH
jgi:hypothetical protein